MTHIPGSEPMVAPSPTQKKMKLQNPILDSISNTKMFSTVFNDSLLLYSKRYNHLVGDI